MIMMMIIVMMKPEEAKTFEKRESYARNLTSELAGPRGMNGDGWWMNELGAVRQSR